MKSSCFPSYITSNMTLRSLVQICLNINIFILFISTILFRTFILVKNREVLKIFSSRDSGKYIHKTHSHNKREHKNLLSLFIFNSQESYTYKDPITEFVQCLYVDFDFDGAQKKLRECETVSMSLLMFLYICFF